MDKTNLHAAWHTIRRKNATRAKSLGRALSMAPHTLLTGVCLSIVFFGIPVILALFAIPIFALLLAGASLCGSAANEFCQDGHFNRIATASYWTLSALSYAASLAATKGSAPAARWLSKDRHVAALEWAALAVGDFGNSFPSLVGGPQGTFTALRLHAWKFIAAALGWPFHAFFWASAKLLRTPSNWDAAIRRLASESPEILALHEAAELDRAASAARGEPPRPRL